MYRLGSTLTDAIDRYRVEVYRAAQAAGVELPDYVLNILREQKEKQSENELVEMARNMDTRCGGYSAWSVVRGTTLGGPVITA
ncbi:hypothetical protein BDV36DRAFT_242003 [Aspergillus pseudocaelatus]|uniref:Ketopantoate reductase C-terminal domain-containing protein n=1 Tax=Aspergillus pseudocaelatus TaxID=1825620 RepID=A0ABQ6X342_9EURO|nr:hypothetical protein BDV36DRAFT_242003 [Aspergillus pseudocaelatus]